MNETPQATQPPEDPGNDRIPLLAVAVVGAGVILSLAIYGLSFVHGAGSQEVSWDTSEAVKAPPPAKVGTGSFAITRTSLSALAPNEDGLLLFRVAGAIRVDSGGRKPTSIRCDVISGVTGDTRMARSTRLRAAWPKPSDELQAQEVPETSTVKFQTSDSKKIDLPISDVIQRYTDSDAPTQVDWDGYVEDDQNWIWTMSQGTGISPATMPWAVIFESETRPRGTVECKATMGKKSSTIKMAYRQQEWPINDDQPNPGDSGTGDVSNVE